MSYVKYIMCVVLVLIGVWASVELYQFHLQDVGEFVTIRAYTENAEDAEDYIDTLATMAKRLSVELFFVDIVYDKNGSQHITFYCAEALHETLQQEYWYREGTMKGMFFGTTVVAYKPLSEIDAKRFSKAEYSCKLYGEDDDVGAFLYLWEEHEGELVSGKGVVKKMVGMCLLMIWAIVICVIGCMTVFERMLGRKEFFVRLSIGESLFKSSLLHIASDIAVYFASVAIALLIVRWLCGAVCFSAYAWGAAGVMSVISMAMYLSLLWNSFRYAFSNAVMSEDTLLFGHFLLACFIAVLLALVPFVCAAYRDYSRVAAQQEFYEGFEGYYRVRFSPYVSDVEDSIYGGDDVDPFYRSDEVNRRFYEENFSKYSASVFAPYVSTVSGLEVCYANANMKSYVEELLRTTIPEGYDAVCFYPKRLSLEMLMQWDLEKSLYAYDGEASVHWIPYEDEITTGMTEALSDEFKTVKNPIIVYESIDSFEEGAWETRNINIPYNQLIYYKCSEEEILAYAEAADLDVFYEDVYAYFYEYYAKAKSSFWCMAGIAALLTGLILFLHITILRLECYVNGMELAIKKTLGITWLDRLFKMYVVTIGFSVLGVVLSVVLLKRLERAFEPMSLLVGAVLLFAQMVIISVVGRKLEKESIQKVLKNG